MLTRSPIPLYFQIANQIETKIGSGEYPAGGFLPPERDLARQFGVSLITVRGAMKSLLDKGLIERLPGKGTLVLHREARAVWELGWLSELITSVLPSRLEIVSMGLSPSPAWVAARFGLQPRAQVHEMQTIRRAVQRADEPFMTTELYHPASIGTHLRRRDFESNAAQTKLVIMTVEEKCGVSIAGARQTMTAERADRKTARLLRIQPGHPLLVVTRDYFDTTGRLVQTGLSKYRTDHYEYVLNVSRGVGRATRRLAGASNRSSAPRN